MDDSAEYTFQELAGILSKLSRSFAHKKINKSLYRRQRSALINYVEGDLNELPELCFNELSQYVEAPDSFSLGSLFANLPGFSQGKGKNGMRKGFIPAFLSLFFGGLIGVLCIIAFG